MSENLNRFDLEKSEKQVRRLFKTPEGIQALRNVTGYNFMLAGEAKEQNKPIVAVLTPSYRGFVPETTQAFHRLVEYSQPFCVVMPEPAVSTSVVHWSRNDLLVKLYKSGKPFDYVLFMDDDMVPAPDHLIKLLEHKKDIVAAACTVRKDPPKPNFRTYDPETFTFSTAFEWSSEGLMAIGGVGTGFMLISRQALDKIADYYLNCEHEKRFLLSPHKVVDDKVKFEKYDENQLPDFLKANVKRLADARWKHLKETGNPWWFEFLKNPLGDGEYGEDISFCFKAHELGLEMFVDTSIHVGHVGSYAYGLADFYQYQHVFLEHEKHKKVMEKNAELAAKSEGETNKVSVLLPSRGRADLLKDTVASLLDNASGEVEVLIRLDDDDPERNRIINNSYFKVLGLSQKLRVITGPRHGYRNLHEYYNELAKEASGQWLMIWNDDARMDTKDWDAKIHQFGDGLKVLNACGDMNLFPIFTKKLHDVLGHVSLNAHNDTWLQAISRSTGIELPVDIKITHLREEIDDERKQESLDTYKTTSPEFFSEAVQLKLEEDMRKVLESLEPKEVTA